jgi:hypothetical protein
MNSTTAIFGINLQTYTLVHVVISLIGIVSGFAVLYGLLTAKRLDRWTALFLTTTVLTSLSGYGFPFERLLPSHIVGMLSLVALAIAIVARYSQNLVGVWRKIYVISACVALYFNCFVLVVQSFEKVPALKAAAPTQKEAPFVVAQLALLAAFIVLTTLAVKKFRSRPVVMPRSTSKVA